MSDKETARRAELVESATDYALEHGLIGLSLRPLARALGTSDRMLLYHFADKDDLVTAVVRASSDRSVAVVRSRPAADDVRAAVRDLWQTADSDELHRCQRLYVEAAALGIFGREPYAGVVREANERWLSAVADHLGRAAGEIGTRTAVIRRAAVLVDAAFNGFQLDQPLGRVPHPMAAPTPPQPRPGGVADASSTPSTRARRRLASPRLERRGHPPAIAEHGLAAADDLVSRGVEDLAEAVRLLLRADD